MADQILRVCAALIRAYPINNNGQLDQVTQDPAQIARYRNATSLRGH